METVFIVVFLGIYTRLVWSAVPDGYIIQVSDECGEDGVEDACITVTSDLDVKAKAVCADGDVWFTDFDIVHLRLSVSYPGRGTSPCVFEQRRHVHVFVVTVFVSFGELSQPIHEGDQEFTITCTFDAKSKNSSSPQGTSDTLIAPVEVQGHEGPSESGTEFDLTLTDILGNDLQDQVAIGRVVQLKATAKGGQAARGVVPDSCDAVSSTSGLRYAVLRGGCGDGIVFQKDDGFITESSVSRSPLFEVFALAGDDLVVFECNFTLCTEECNGSTCTMNLNRRRRSSRVRETVVMKTQAIHLDKD